MSTHTAHRTGSDDTAEPQTAPRAPRRFAWARPAANRTKRTARPTRTAPAPSAPAEPRAAAPAPAAEPVRSVARLELPAEPTAVPTPGTAPAAAPRGRGSYWFAEVASLVPLAAPLLLEASVHRRIAEHFLHMGLLSWLLPASVGLGAVTVAFRFDRARLNRDPVGMIRVVLYGYVAAGFALSYWFLTTVPAEGETEVQPYAEVPAVVLGLAGAASVILWELRTRDRHRAALRARQAVDEDAVRRWFTFPKWAARMRRFAIATGQDACAVQRAFAPLIAAELAGRTVAAYPDVLVDAPPAPAAPAPAHREPRAPRTAPAPRAKAAAPATITGPHRPGDEPLFAAILEAYPATEPALPSRASIMDLLDIGSTKAGRLQTAYNAHRTAQAAAPAAASQ